MDTHGPPAILAKEDALKATLVCGNDYSIQIGGITRSSFDNHFVLHALDIHSFEGQARFRAIPEGADQIRSYHPWGLLMDEAAFQPEAGEAYDAAVPVCEKIVVVSSAGPGWFADFVTDIL